MRRDERLKRAVRERYGRIARRGGSCCAAPGSSCCGPPGLSSAALGYSDDELRSLPSGADMGLGCGTPVAHASLRRGETVLDLGSGAGIDCFLAARRVGPKGRVIGVDMTPGMVARARAAARRGGYTNVEFKLGELERLPVPDSSVDAVISNCVINLVPDKARVFREAFRVLRPGGRLVVSDIVLRGELPECVRRSVRAHTSCIAGAVPEDEYLRLIRSAGFRRLRVLQERGISGDELVEGAGGFNEERLKVARALASLTVRAVRPRARRRQSVT
ncbi:MAG: arsenite methyltransferase [Thermoplasmata archaeon]